MLGRVGQLVVISPHCDDAVFACGRLLEAHPGSLVVTVCAGRPPADVPLTEWDRAAGFQQGDDVMGIRREEDRAALTLLAAHPVWLDFRDSQYDRSPSPEAVMEVLHEVICAATANVIVLPLGLFHSDHVLTHQATLLLRRRHARLSWFIYADALYRQLPGLTESRLKECESRGLSLQPTEFPVNAASDRKHAAVHCYQSQLRALATPGRPGHADTASQETFWRLVNEE
ncbi:MAG TPA: PIG-L family deacetylase [Nitrospiraceae bacterium]|nr:PIG-L family deacetylase [Nitrospiraceae bacterium]